MWPTTEPMPDVAPCATGGATLDVEYSGGDATLHLVADPTDVDAGARLLCAAVGHVRRRHVRRVHTAVDLTVPAGGVLLGALHSRVGTDVAAIVMRRAGSTAMVTLELLPAPTRPGLAHDAVAHHRGEPPRLRRPGAPRPRVARTAPC